MRRPSNRAALGDEVAKEARQRPLALELACRLRVRDTVLVVNVLDVVVADRAKALGLVRRLRTAGGEHGGAAKALAQGLPDGSRSEHSVRCLEQ
jgi:hypothetical protein